jgi:hypothetical protein
MAAYAGSVLFSQNPCSGEKDTLCVFDMLCMTWELPRGVASASNASVDTVDLARRALKRQTSLELAENDFRQAPAVTAGRGSFFVIEIPLSIRRVISLSSRNKIVSAWVRTEDAMRILRKDHARVLAEASLREPLVCNSLVVPFAIHRLLRSVLPSSPEVNR